MVSDTNQRSFEQNISPKSSALKVGIGNDKKVCEKCMI